MSNTATPITAARTHLGYIGLVHNLGEDDARQGSHLAGLQNHRAPRGQRGRHLHSNQQPSVITGMKPCACQCEQNKRTADQQEYFSHPQHIKANSEVFLTGTTQAAFGPPLSYVHMPCTQSG